MNSYEEKPSSESSSVRCAACGAILTESLPQNLCPACVMRRVFTPTVSEAAEAADPERTHSLHENSSAQRAGPSGDRQSGVELVGGQHFGEYTIVKRLGRGGMGTVYEADHAPTGRCVALKVLTHSLDNPKARARFLREGRLAASINHPNSVYVYGTEEIGDTPSISMELIRGGTLQQWVRTRGRMGVAAAVDAVLQIVDGLEAADRKGVLHRDVKPANCFIDPSGTIKVGDFGLSISTEARDDHAITNVTQEGILLGTPAFASPEQLRGEPLDRRSDIYSVGVTLYYLLTGVTPFSADNMVHLLATVLDKPAPSVRSIRDDVPEELDLLLQRCLQKSPGQRFASYDALRAALLPMSSRHPLPASLGARLIANIIDVVALSTVLMFVTYTWQWLVYGYLILVPRFGPDHAAYNVGITLFTVAVPIFYYAFFEWRRGKTLGKHLMRLRVVGHDQRMTFRQALIRTAIFVILPNIPSMVYSVSVRDMTFAEMQQGVVSWVGMAVGLSFYALKFGLFATARGRNGYAGMHELASGTRVICTPSMRSRPTESELPESFDAGRSDEKIGPYFVLRTLWGNETNRLVLAYDAKLLRRVWIHVQPSGSPDVTSNVRNLARSTRLRWLGAKRTQSECWDCYEALSGQPLVKAIDDGLSWEVTANAMWQLAYELKAAQRESSLPAKTTLAQLWITDEEIVKLLPFVPGEDMAADLADEAGVKSRAPENLAGVELDLLRDALRYTLDANRLGRDVRAKSGASLSDRETMAKICRAESLDQAAEQLARLAAQPAANVRRRTAGLLVVSLVVPTILFLSAFVASTAMERQKANMPEVAELGKALVLLEIENQIERPDKMERMASVETWIAAHYREVTEDRSQMESFYSMTAIPPHRRERLKALMAKPAPTPEAITAANADYERILAEPRTTVPADIGFFSLDGLVFLSSVAWMETIWIPSLLSAVVCGGGALLWMFGLTLVNRHGQRASRLRVLFRMMIGGIPVVAYAYLQLMSRGPGGYAGPFRITLILAIVCAAIFAIFSGRRMLHDRLAGTYLVAR